MEIAWRRVKERRRKGKVGERDGAVVEQKIEEKGRDFADLSSRSRWMRRFIDVGPLSETRSSRRGAGGTFKSANSELRAG